MSANERLKDFRIRAGVSVTKLCTKLDINGPSYRRYERGEVSPKIELCIDICKALDCSLDDIWGEAHVAPPQVDVSYRARPGQTVYLKIDVDANDDDQLYQTPLKVNDQNDKQQSNVRLKKESKTINGE